MSLFNSASMIKRSHAGRYEKGRWVKGAPEEEPFRGTVQPASGKALELLPEGKRSNETIRVIAPLSLDFSPADSQAQKGGDVVIWEGARYEVLTAKAHKAGLLPHWDILASRVKGGGE